MSELDSDTPTPDDILAAFLNRYWKDQGAGLTPGLAHYLELFPGHDALLASEFLSLTTKAKAPVSAQDGSELGPYRILEEIGRGGQGVVYKAEDTRLNRVVALKILTGLGPGSEETVQRFRREAEVASKLDHPGICSVHDAGMIDGIPYIAMQHVEGNSLAEKIASSDAAEETSIFSSFEDEAEGDAKAGTPSSSTATKREILEILALFEKAARALHAAHEAGVVHRDIKPGNIMVSADGDPILLDFGLARSDDVDLQTLTRTGDLFGTPAYMSPEQLMGQRLRLDRRTDVYSLGAALFECLTLKRPFEAPTREALYQQIMTHEAPDPRRLNAHVPPELKVVLETALEKDRERRYQTAAAFADDLARVRKLEPIAARPLSRWLKTKRWAQRNPVVATLLVALVLFLGSGLAWTFAKNRELDASNTRLDLEKSTAQEALADVQRLADVRVLRDLEQRAKTELWPSLPEKAEAMQAWMAQADQLESRAGLHRQKLAQLRSRALPYDDRQRDEDWSEERARITLLEDQLADLNASLEDATEHNVERIEDQIDDTEEELDRLRDHVKMRRTWHFESTEDAWLHDVLAALVQGLDACFADAGGTRSDVAKRLAFATALRQRSVADHAVLWRKTIEGIKKSDIYPGLRLTGLEPQVGLIPLGPDPISGLYEFLHLASHEGAVLERDDDGVLQRAEQTGIILVLIPGGRFDMGAERDPASTNYDPDARRDEGPVHSVTLSAFFLSKFEMTQGQWARVQSGATPSHYGAGKRPWGATPLHPVEQVSWTECDRALMQIDLELPTEAQWEYGARAQTSSVWSTGSDVMSLEGAANIADAGSARFYPRGWKHERFEDGYAFHAPVGSFDANAFGLHDVHGNLGEWCRDMFATYAEANPESGTGLREPPGFLARVLRGGSFGDSATTARSANRSWFEPSYRHLSLGLRPARALR